MILEEPEEYYSSSPTSSHHTHKRSSLGGSSEGIGSGDSEEWGGGERVIELALTVYQILHENYSLTNSTSS